MTIGDPKTEMFAIMSSESQSSDATIIKTGFWSTLFGGIPNLIVFLMLAGVMALGHQTGWKLPKLGLLLNQQAVEADDWCSEHLVPESNCIECLPTLLLKEPELGFCQEHGVAECVIHHPERAQVNDAPRLPKYDTVAAIALLGRIENNSRNTLHTQRIQFASIESFNKSGIDVDIVQEREMVDVVTANGELVYDPTRVAHLSSRVAGSVALVVSTIGERVAQGDILALVDSAQVGQTKAQLLQTMVQLQLKKSTIDRLRPVSEGGAVSQRLLIEAEAEVQKAEIEFISARQSLANLGFELPSDMDVADPTKLADELRFVGVPEKLIAALPAGSKTANLIPLRAPYSGMVVDADIVAGEVVDSATSLFTVADPSRLWLQLNVRPEEARFVRVGLSVEFQPDDGPSTPPATVSWISPGVNDTSRTLQVRVVIDNANGLFRDRSFGMGRIVLRREPNAIVVPRESVQSTADASFVFVRDKNYFNENSPKLFHVRQVRVGAKDGQFIELLAGVLPGEVIATKGSASLLAQLMRNSFGEGCACHKH